MQETLLFPGVFRYGLCFHFRCET